MHIGAFDAEMLWPLLRLHRAKGFRLVTLPQAEGDAFNDNDNDVNLSLPPDPETMEDAMKARRLLLPARTDFGAQLDPLCR
jgi:hypothetical protein